MVRTMAMAMSCQLSTIWWMGVFAPMRTKMRVLTRNAAVSHVLNTEIFVWGLIAYSAPRLPMSSPAVTVAMTPLTWK